MVWVSFVSGAMNWYDEEVTLSIMYFFSEFSIESFYFIEFIDRSYI